MTDRRPTITRCRDSLKIERLLLHDYYDTPVCFFPARLARAAARWMADATSVCFVVAEVAGEPGGFVFAHTLGPRMWRGFALRHAHLLPYTGYAFLRSRAGKALAVVSHAPHAVPQSAPREVERLDLPRVDAPFEWSEPDSKTAYVAMVYVAAPLRGRGLAPAMLRFAADELGADGVRRIEAHIDAANYASLRAFLGAGWNVLRTGSGAFKADLELDTRRT